MGYMKHYAMEARERYMAALESAQTAFDAGLQNEDGTRSVGREDLETIQRLVASVCIEGDRQICQIYPMHCVAGRAHDPQYNACVCGHGLLYHGGGGAAGDECHAPASAGYECDCGEYQYRRMAGEVLAAH